MYPDSSKWAYIVGVALGDGNLSNPNGRAIRLRVTCDSKYPAIIKEIVDTLTALLPLNKVSLVKVRNKPRAINISVYSNTLSDYMPWQCGAGTKFKQKARVPNWIIVDTHYAKACLKGLLQTDGSIYFDRGYTMVNFTNETAELANDVYTMLLNLGFKPRMYCVMGKIRQKYTVRVARDSQLLIDTIELRKQ